MFSSGGFSLKVATWVSRAAAGFPTSKTLFMRMLRGVLGDPNSLGEPSGFDRPALVAAIVEISITIATINICGFQQNLRGGLPGPFSRLSHTASIFYSTRAGGKVRQTPE